MIIANWKMNGSKELITSWISYFSKNVSIDTTKPCIFMPPSCYLDFVKTKILEEKTDLKLGSQSFASGNFNPLTGGISIEMLSDIGCEYVLIGHSEERDYLRESENTLIDKVDIAINNGLKTIFCIGENLEVKNHGKTREILSKQLDVIKSIEENNLDKLIIAYEPIWAIGTGENAAISYINEIHTFIKNELKIKLNSSKIVPIIYGGSVNLKNCEEIYSSENVDGLLIGGASLNHKVFSTIYNLT